jgi:outer membrane protein assembly factor BamB
LGARVVVSLEEGALAAIAVDDGQVLWRRDLPSPLGLPALDSDRAYVVAGEELHAFDITTGEERWRAPAAAGTSPSLSANTVYVLTASDRIAAYDAEEGSRLWELDLERPAGALPVVAHGALIIPLRVNMDGTSPLIALEDPR